MRSSQVAGRATRVKKLAKNTTQQVLREDQLDSAEYSSLQTQSNIETGVENSEEKARDYTDRSHDAFANILSGIPSPSRLERGLGWK